MSHADSRWIRPPAAAVVGLLVLMTFAGPLPPARAGDGIGLSTDGEHWAPSIEVPLFARDIRWVPGDRRTRSFYVRNDGPGPASLSIGVRAADVDRLLTDNQVALSARADVGPWVRLAHGQPRFRLSEATLADGDVVRVEVRVRFRWYSTNESQRASVPFVLAVTLGASGRDDGLGQDDGELPGVGSSVPVALVWLALALIGIGALLLGRLARRTEGGDVERVDPVGATSRRSVTTLDP